MPHTVERAVLGLLLVCGAALTCGCGPRLDLGSDVLWASLFEGNTFDEWTGDGAGSAFAFPESGNRVEVSAERVRRGAYAAKLTVEAVPGGETKAVALRVKGSKLRLLRRSAKARSAVAAAKVTDGSAKVANPP